MTGAEPGVLLADVARAGAYFVDIHDRAALAEAAISLGFAVIRVDLEFVDDKAGLLDELAAALEFPPEFGGNWDALSDSLGDLSWRPAPGHVLLLDHCGGLRESAPGDFATLLDILDEAAATHAASGTPFWSLLPVASTPP